MRYGVLGPLQVRTASGEPVAAGGPRPRALLVMLLLNAGRQVSVEQLIDGQYGDDPPAGAANAIQAQVSRLRRTLPDPIEFHGNAYKLAVDPDEVDVHRFESLLKQGALDEALELWRGEPLADLPYGAAQKARLEDLRLTALEATTTSVADLRALVAEHPLRERLAGQLMRALHADGRSAEALAEYDRIRRLLADQLGADPSAELSEVNLAILRADRPKLPAQLTSFVGRESDLARLAELRTARLVTILGPGGIGKTRLAIEAAGRDERAACFADFAPADRPEQVPLAVLAALGHRESAADPTERLANALADRELLLVFDNCEQVVDAVAALARRLLADCPRLAIRATSREPLGLTGETLVPLAQLADSPAMRLFADRGAAVRPGFAITPENRDTIAEICAALDGLPLAIELAAARLRQFGVEEIGVRLAEPFRLLSRGDRTAAARHRTLEAAVQWSWDLLDPDERLLAARFTVFTGGATLSAVEAVCAVAPNGTFGASDAPKVPFGPTRPAEEVLFGLVDKSLVETDGERYRMLETIRLFCAARITDDVRPKHARYFLDLAQKADPHLRRAEQLEWLRMLSADHDNLMAALRWAVTGDRETALRMMSALGAYWWLSARRSQAGEAASALLAGEIPAGFEEEYVSCVVHATQATEEQWAKAGNIVRTLDHEFRHPFGLALWGMAAGPPPDDADPTPVLGDDPWNIAMAKLSMVLLGMLGGQAAAGETEMRDVLESFRALGERWGTAQALDWLAVLASWRGEWRRADDLWTEAAGLHEQLGALEESASVLCHRSDSYLRQGKLDAAEEDVRTAATLLRTAGFGELSTEVRLATAEVARIRGETGKALGLLEETEEEGWKRGLVFTTLARVKENDAQLHRKAVAAAGKSPFISDLAHAIEGAAAIAEPDQGALLLGVAVALRGVTVAGDPDVAYAARRATEAIGAKAFASAYARGAGMSRDEALTTIDDAVSRL